MNLTLAAHQFQRTQLRLAMVAAALMVTGGTALADEPICGTRAEIMKPLIEKFGERSVGIGQDESGMLVELLTNADGSTWTLLVHRPDGSTCVLTVGENWQTHKNQASLGRPS